MRNLKAMMNNPTKRDKYIKDMAQKCVKYMKNQAMEKARKGARYDQEFRTAELMNNIQIPDDFELRWDVSRGIFDAMTLATKMGIVKRGYSQGGSWRYSGSDAEKIKKQYEKEEANKKKTLRAAAKRVGVNAKIVNHWRTKKYEITLSEEDFLKLTNKKK